MPDSNPLALRISEYLKTYNISMTKFSKDNGWDPSTIIRQLTCKSTLSAETVNGFVNTFINDGINLSWLFFGEGPMRITDPYTPQPQSQNVHYNVKASAVADATPRPYQTAAEAPQSLDLAAALDVIKSQQQIIQRQTEMLENLLKNQNQ